MCQLKSASLYSLNILIGDWCVSAVVDSAAEVSIISDKVYLLLKKYPPKTLQEITLHTTVQLIVIRGFIVGPVS